MNTIHPTAIIGDSVVIGTGNTIGPYAVILGNVKIGNDNWIGSHAAIGGPAEIRGADLPASWQMRGEHGQISIGNNTVVRESCVIHAGYFSGTRIGDDCYIMNQAYVAHDCTLGDQVTLSSHVALGGHVAVQKGANLGMGAVVHQRRVIGAMCMIGMGSVVTRDINPYSKAFGNPARVMGSNRVGMERAKFDDDLIHKITSALDSADVDALRKLIPAEMSMFDSVTTSRPA